MSSSTRSAITGRSATAARQTLKILLNAADSAKHDVSSIKHALVSGAAFPKSLLEEIKSRGIDAYRVFGTADLGMVAFETEARDGMVVNEDLILEIVRPGTGDPVAPGDVGEIVVTSLDSQLGGSVELVPTGVLPNDGRVIADER